MVQVVQVLRQVVALVDAKFRNEPLSAGRLVFWFTLWPLTLAHMTINLRLFHNSFPFAVLNQSNLPSMRSGLEDSRRQALPVLIAADVILTFLMPFLVGLPACGFGLSMDRLLVEFLWSGLTSVLLLGGSAALAPIPSSPTLPTALKADLSSSLGLSFMLFNFLVLYTLFLLVRCSFLLGQGVRNIIYLPATSFFDHKMDSTSPSQSHDNITPFMIDLEKNPSGISNHSHEHSNSSPNALQDGAHFENVGCLSSSRMDSMKTLSSGWDDEEDDKKTKREKRKTKTKLRAQPKKLSLLPTLSCQNPS